jgi:hypothetical protein
MSQVVVMRNTAGHGMISNEVQSGTRGVMSSEVQSGNMADRVMMTF